MDAQNAGTGMGEQGQGKGPADNPGGAGGGDATLEVARLQRELDRANRDKDELKKVNKRQETELSKFRTEEQAAAARKQEEDEEKDRKIAAYEKQLAVTDICASLIDLGFLGDKKAVSPVAEALYGADNPAIVINAIANAWKAKVKELELKHSKLPGPGVGAGGEDGPKYKRSEIQKMSYKERMALAREHPEAYQAAMSGKE